MPLPILVITFWASLYYFLISAISRLITFIGIGFVIYTNTEELIENVRTSILAELNNLSTIQLFAINAIDVLEYTGIINGIEMILAAYATKFAWKTFNVIVK